MVDSVAVVLAVVVVESVVVVLSLVVVVLAVVVVDIVVVVCHLQFLRWWIQLQLYSFGCS